MRIIELIIGGTAIRARLLDELAPKTCEAIWNALPFGGRAVHTITCGNMIRMLDEAPIDIGVVESGVGHQYPGLMVFHWPIKEIAVSYDTALYRDTANVLLVTPFAEVLGDLEKLRQISPKLQWNGATPIEFRRVEGMTEIEPLPPMSGTKIEVQIDDLVITATLFEDIAPRTCEAFIKLLPLQGPVINNKWCGSIARFWGSEDGHGAVGMNVKPPEVPTQMHWPGIIYYHINRDGIRICYGDGSMCGPFMVANMTPLARFEDNWSDFREKAANLYLNGSAKLIFRLKD